jgi:hypothetical protein
MAKLAHLLDTAWADFALDNPVAVARAVALLREDLATLPEDGHLHGPTADFVYALESNPATARAAWAEWVAVSSVAARRDLGLKQAERRSSGLTIEGIRETMHGLEYRHATKEKVAARLKVNPSTIDRALRTGGVDWKQIKAAHPGKR